MKLLVLLFLITGCASSPESRMKKWKSMGYSKSDAKLVDKYSMKYGQAHAKAVAARTAFDSSSYTSSENKLRRIFCKCVAKLGDKCQKTTSKNVAKENHLLWAKGHSAYMTQKNMGGSVILGTYGNTEFDPDEC